MLVAGSSRSSALVLQVTSRTPENVSPGDTREGRTFGNLPTVSLTPAHNSKLADALWSMESNGVVLDQKPDDVWLNKKPESPATDEFLKVSSMTPAERIRFFFLKDRDLNEDMLAAMKPHEREAIEEQIRQVILERLGLEDEDGKSSKDRTASATEDPIAVANADPHP
jgi:hypothetical protein